jgi:AcrR family transcriptional regulator
MDDIAQDLGISKKTIYKWFENKDHLVHELIEFSLCAPCVTNKIREENAVEEFCVTFNQQIQNLVKFHTSFFNDLKKYHPLAHQIWTGFKENNIIQQFRANIQKGITTGLYQPDLDPDVLARLYVGQLETIYTSDLFPAEQFNRLHVYKFNLRHFIQSIVTPAGQECLNEIMARTCCV